MIGGRRIAIALAILALLARPAAAQAPASADDPGTMAAFSIAIQAGTVAEAFWYREDFFPWLMLGTATVQHLPAILYGTDDRWLNAGIQLGLDAAFFANRLAFVENALTPVLFNVAHKFSMFATYDAYADLRTRSVDAAYAAGIDRRSFGELALAPFEPANYASWPVLGYLGSVGAIAAVSLFTAPDGESVWDTGSAWLGGREYPAWLGIPLALALQVPNFIMTGVGEEALYRGTIYEELSVRLGEWPAKVVDALYFTGSHLPQKWDQLKEMGAVRLIFSMALSIGQSFWFQYIYEWQGLEAAVAAHAMSDIVVFFIDWLAYGGVPNAHGFSINERGGLSISFDL